MTTTFDLLLRSHVSRGRLIATFAGAVLLILVGIAVSLGGGSGADALDVIGQAGASLLVPVVAVVYATAMLGDPADDGTLGYLLTTPRPRWQLALPAWSAAIAVVVPGVAVPIAVALGVNDLDPATVVAHTAAAVVGVLAYCAVFLPLGLVTRFSLVAGLLYSAIWEGVVAGVGDGLARLSVRQYVDSLAAWIAGDPVPSRGVEGATATVVLALTVVGGLALTTWLLRRHTVRA